MEGLAPDGGLYLPERASKAPVDFYHKWKDLSFADLAVEIFKLYVDPKEIPFEDLKKLTERTYSTFRSKDVTPLHVLNRGQQLFTLELFHGPTYAFKDVALQLVGNLFEYFLARKNKGKAADSPDRDFITVVGATSGDTGSAAIYGLRNKKDVSVFILYPNGRVSTTQEQQMTTVLDENVHTISVPGTFDDCQNLVKEMFGDKKFNSMYHLGAVNSINWARILSQITYYFKAYFELCREFPEPPRKPKFVVPSGNFGDMLAGYYAKEMGLPVDLCVSTNSNDILYRFLNTGTYSKEGQVHATLSPAMDILISSNFERFLWAAARQTIATSNVAAGKLLNDWMDSLKSKGSFKVPSEVFEKAKSTFSAQRASDDDTIAAIRKVYTEFDPGYVIDPHTAVGVHGALQEKIGDKGKYDAYVVLSTAHPAKFDDAVNKALSTVKGFNFEKEVLPKEFIKMLEAENKKIFAKTTSKKEIQDIIVSNL